MKKNSCLFVICVLACCLTGCADAEYERTFSQKEIDDAYDRGYKNGLEEAPEEIIDEMVDAEIPYDGYVDGVIRLLEDATSYPETTKQIIDLCDNVGYYSSVLLGKYCIDDKTMTIHMTDSDCISSQEEPDLDLFITYAGTYEQLEMLETIEGIERLIKENDYLKKLDITYCPICIEK